MTTLLLDNLRYIETPEGVVLALRPAGVVVRALAFCIDLFIRAALFATFAIPIAILLEGYASAMILIYLFLLNWLYPVFFEVWRGGATPGKKSMRIRVIHDNGTPITLPASLIRNLLRIVDMLPFFYLAGLMSMCFTADFRRLGDLAAGTMVEHLPPIAIPSQEQEIALTPLRLTSQPELEERRSIFNWAERRHLLGEQRSQELAALLGDEQLTAAEAEQRLARVVLYLKQGGG